MGLQRPRMQIWHMMRRVYYLLIVHDMRATMPIVICICICRWDPHMCKYMRTLIFPFAEHLVNLLHPSMTQCTITSARHGETEWDQVGVFTNDMLNICGARSTRHTRDLFHGAFLVVARFAWRTHKNACLLTQGLVPIGSWCSWKTHTPTRMLVFCPSGWPIGTCNVCIYINLYAACAYRLEGAYKDS